MSFTRCKHQGHGGEADLATEALEHWAALGWRPVDEPAPQPAPKPAPKRARKAADQSAEK